MALSIFDSTLHAGTEYTALIGLFLAYTTSLGYFYIVIHQAHENSLHMMNKTIEKYVPLRLCVTCVHLIFFPSSLAYTAPVILPTTGQEKALIKLPKRDRNAEKAFGKKLFFRVFSDRVLHLFTAYMGRITQD